MTLPALRIVHSPNFSSRNGVGVRLVVVHDCEGSYEGSVAWFQNSKSQVSAHLVINEAGTEATQMVPFANKAWHACYFNSMSEGIEAAGFAAKGLGEPEWRALAEVVAYRLHARNLPARWARDGGGSGFCQHVDLGSAGGGHHDVTSDPAVWQHFCELVQEAYAKPQQTWNVSLHGPMLNAPPSGWAPQMTKRHDLVQGSVEWAQAQLNMLGLSATNLMVDGLDGHETRLATAAFQRAMRLPPTGELDAATIHELSLK